MSDFRNPPTPPWADTSPWQWRTRLRGWRFALAAPADPWARVAAPVNWAWLAPAARHDWREYFSGTSTAPVANLDALCAWLAGCHYCPDEVRDDGRDRWLHPLEFEANRIGDCEDHALWAWRQLAGLGFPAEFVVGLFKPDTERHVVNHAWVHFHDGRQFWVFETTVKQRAGMLLNLDAARPSYMPAASIDHRFESHAFANLFHFRATGRSMRLPSRCGGTSVARPVG